MSQSRVQHPHLAHLENAATSAQNAQEANADALNQMGALTDQLPETITKLSPTAKNCVIAASVVAAVGAAAWAVNKAHQHAEQQEASFNARLEENARQISHVERLEAQRAEQPLVALAH